MFRAFAQLLPYRFRAAARRVTGPSRRSLSEQITGHRAAREAMADALESAVAGRRAAEAEAGHLRELHRAAGQDAERLRALNRGTEEEVGRLREMYRATEEEAGRLRDLYLTARAGLALPPDRRATTAELVAALAAGGVPVTTADRVLLHVGYGHAATTSLQLGFFPHRPDLCYLGTPYREAGGLFSYIKYLEDAATDPAEMYRLCRDHVYAHPDRAGRPLVVSDETFLETPEVYYAPRLLPPDVVAARLRRYFPTARVLFTVRSQFDYVRSMYFNLKRNYGFLAGMPVPPFAEWWDGMHTQVRCLRLLNLDYSRAVRVYAEAFGRENVMVLPLEELIARGPEAYLGRLCGFLDIPLGRADADQFRRPHNTRMSVVEARAADLIAARHAGPVVRDALDNPTLAELAAAAPKLDLEFGEGVREQIRNQVAAGNRWLAGAFDLPLAEYGYPV